MLGKTLSFYLSTLILVQHANTVSCACYQNYTYGSDTPTASYIGFFSITKNSKGDIDYHILHKELALQQYFLLKAYSVTIYDVCNTESVLLEILVDYLIYKPLKRTAYNVVSYLSPELTMLTANVLTGVNNKEYYAMIKSDFSRGNNEGKFSIVVIDDGQLFHTTVSSTALSINGIVFPDNSLKGLLIPTSGYFLDCINPIDIRKRRRRYLDMFEYAEETCTLFIVSFCQSIGSKCVCERSNGKPEAALADKFLGITVYYQMSTSTNYQDFIKEIRETENPGIIYFPTNENEVRSFQTLDKELTTTYSRTIQKRQTYTTDCSNSTFINTSTNTTGCSVEDTYFTVMWLEQGEQVEEKEDEFTVLEKALQKIKQIKNGTYFCLPECNTGYTKQDTIDTEKGNYVMTCIECPGNSVKADIGYHKCIPCDSKRGWFANDQKSECVDRFKTYDLKFTDDMSIVIMGLSGIALSCFSITLTLFMRQKETLIVKTSNFWMSITQLLSNLFITTLTPFLFIGEPSNMICIMRLAVISILMPLSFITTIVKCKTLCLIYKAKIKLTVKEIKKAKATEFFLAFLSIAIGLCILAVSLQNKSTYVEEYLSEEEQYRETHCSTESSITLLFAYFELLSMYSIYQAYQARRLPSVLKETRVMGMSSILTLFIVGAALWLQSTVKMYYQLRLVVFFSIYCTVMVNYLFIYSYKVFIMVFIPKMNTKEYYKNIIQNRGIKDVENSVAKRSKKKTKGKN